MSESMIGFALLGAFMVTAPAVLADYELFKEWREEKDTVYPKGSEVVTLLTIGKDGELGRTDGSLYVVSNNDAWTVESNFQDFPNRFWINLDGSDLALYYDVGFALIGSRGSGGIMTMITGLRRDMSFHFDGTWCLLEDVLGISTFLMGIEYQSYLDGAKTNSYQVDVTNDAMQTFLWCPDIRLLGIDPSGSGFGIQLTNELRNGSSFSIVAIKRPTEVPEPATLAAVGAGLVGLGLLPSALNALDYFFIYFYSSDCV